MTGIRVFVASASLELAHLRRNAAFVALTFLAAVSFLVMVALFGLTGSWAPVALIDRDGGAEARSLVEALENAHHSFSLRRMSDEQARAALRSGRLTGIITIPAGFTHDVEAGETVPIGIEIDNVNVDLTNDVQRALPAAIVAFGRAHNFPGTRVRVEEHDVLPHDTGYIEYLAVSALALDAMVIGGILGALATSREFERGTIAMLRVAPAPAGWVLAGKLAVASAVGSGALAVTVVAVVLIFGVAPASWPAAILTLVACTAIFTCFGAWLGAILKRAMAAAPLLFGLAMPFYVDSGALEPTRFDGETIWRIAHLSPIYYAVGAMEWAYHGLRVTPEPVYADLLVLIAFSVAAALLTVVSLSRRAAQ